MWAKRIHILLLKIRRCYGRLLSNDTTKPDPNQALRNFRRVLRCSILESIQIAILRHWQKTRRYYFFIVRTENVIDESDWKKSSFIKRYFFLCSTTKYNMGQPPSNQAFKCNVTLVAETSINLLASGIFGFEPVVFVFSKSDSSPVPILKYNASSDIHLLRQLRRDLCPYKLYAVTAIW